MKMKLLCWSPAEAFQFIYAAIAEEHSTTANQLRRGAIIKDYIGNNAACKNARRKLNSMDILLATAVLSIVSRI
jgi:hypothetical protein